MDLTPEEMKNGWTPESLARYIREREKASQEVLDWTARKQERPQRAVKKSPFKWRR